MMKAGRVKVPSETNTQTTMPCEIYMRPVSFRITRNMTAGFLNGIITRDALRAARVENSVEYLCRRHILHRSHKL